MIASLLMLPVIACVMFYAGIGPDGRRQIVDEVRRSIAWRRFVRDERRGRMT